MLRKKISLILVLATIAGSGLWCCRINYSPSTVEARAKEIHSRVLTLDSHCDTSLDLLRKDWEIGERHDPSEKSSGKIDLPRMKEGGLDAEFFSAFVSQGPRTPEGNAKAKQTALMILEAIAKMCRDYPDLIGPAFSPEDAWRLKKEGKLSAFIGMENGYPLGDDLSLLKFYYGKGVRYLTLCHTSDNDICDSSSDRSDALDKGLSEFGKKVVFECNRLGLLVDVSHISDKSFEDVLKITKAPVIASHSCCRALCENPRNLSDSQLRALAKNGGVIQICFYSRYIKTPKPNPERDKALADLDAKYERDKDHLDDAAHLAAMTEYEDLKQKYHEEKATIQDLVDHIDHVVKVIGIDYVGIGTDFDGGGGVIGCEDVSGMIHITEELLHRGYAENEIGRIWSGNFMRVFRKAIDISGHIKIDM